MKKYIFLLIFLISLCSLKIFSNPRTLEEALGVAENFILKKTPVSHTKFAKGLKFDLVYTGSSNFTKKSLQNPNYYVFNINEKDGFIIVSGDDNANEILAYSYESSFELENIPPGLEYWLDFYEDEIRSLNQQENINLSSISTLEDNFLLSIEPLVEAKWNQDFPFNMYAPEIPESNGNKAVAGCVATGMAQVMHYYQWPVKGDSAKTYTTRTHGIELSVDYSDTYYDWANMTNIYDANNTDIENEAVGLLLYHVGTSVEMNYGETSGAYTRDVAKAFTDFFNYDKNVRYLQRAYYNFSEWKYLIKNELNEGRPVLYAGSATSGAHLFVCDGYDENEFFHINWGWGGSSDGYFALTALNPGTQGIGGYTGGYNRSQEMIIGIQKPTGEEKEQYYEICMRDAPDISGYRVNRRDTFNLTLSSIYNRGSNLFTGKFGVGLYSGDGLEYVIEEKKVDSLRSNYGWGSYSINTIINEEVNNGYYKLFIVYQGHDQSEWNIVRGVGGINNHLNALVTNNYTYFSEVQGITPSLKINSVETVGSYYNGRVGRVKANVSNTGAEYNSYLFFCLESVSDGTVVFLSPNEVFFLEHGETKDITFEIDLSSVSAGNYNFYIMEDGYNNFSTTYRRFLTHDPVKLDVQKLPSGSVSLGLLSKIYHPDPENVLNGNIEITAHVINNGIYFTDYISAYLAKSGEGSSNHRFGYQRIYLENNEEILLTFTETEKLETGDYVIQLVYFDGNTIKYFSNINYSLLYITVKDDLSSTTSNIANEYNLYVYPNPSSDFIFVESEEIIRFIDVYDISGKKIKHFSLEGLSNTKIDVSELKSGLYIMNIHSHSGVYYHQIIKK